MRTKEKEDFLILLRDALELSQGQSLQVLKSMDVTIVAIPDVCGDGYIHVPQIKVEFK